VRVVILGRGISFRGANVPLVAGLIEVRLRHHDEALNRHHDLKGNNKHSSSSGGTIKMKSNS